MKARWLLNLALLALVTALAAFAWWRSQEQARDPRAPLTALAPADVTRVTIGRAPREPIVLERASSGWRLIQPVKGRANGFAVDNLLRLATAPIEATLAPSIEPARYGLAPPAASVRLNDVAIDFGQMHPLNAWHYVRVGDAVHLIGSRYYAQVVAPYNNYLDSRLIEEGRIPIAYRLPGFRVERDDSGGWRRVPPDKNLSSDRVNDFVEEWRNARALQIERYSGRAVLERIALEFSGSDGKTETLNLGVLARQPELVLYRADEGLEYHFPEETGKRLLMLRDTTPSPSLPRNAGEG